MLRNENYIYKGETYIYLKEDIEYGCQVIIKEPARDHPPEHEMDALNKEYEFSRSLNIDGVRRALKKEIAGGKPVLTLEYIEGETLQDYIRAAQININDRLEIAIKLAAILWELHQRNIIYNDLNSMNILVDKSDRSVVIIDFGSAVRDSTKNHQGEKNELSIDTGGSGSTVPDNSPAQNIEDIRYRNKLLPFISPEQTGRMNRIVDYRTDLYSLGIVLYELFTGRLPFQSEDPQEVIHKQIAEQPVIPIIINPDIPEVLSNIIIKLLAKPPEDRYQSASGLKADLTKCLVLFKKNGIIETFPIAKEDCLAVLRMPQKLYGRDEELQILRDAMCRVSEGSSEIVMVAGYAGIGKTVLIKELKKSVINGNGFFIEGKYEQHRWGTPYIGISGAFHEFVLSVLSRPDEEFQTWKGLIQKAVGNLGKLLTDVVPGLELIIGRQNDVPALGGQGAQNRFNYVFLRFVNTITSGVCPLILFIDDLQWIDAASLNLVKALITGIEQGGLLLIGAYRDNEIDETHPLTLTLEEIGKQGIAVNILTLQNLSENYTDELVNGTLNPNKSTVALGALLYEKTRGNPFFVRRLLHSLYERGQITFNPGEQIWEWDINAIRRLHITDNVVDLLTKDLQTIDQGTRDTLILAACIGSRFDRSILSVISHRTEEEINRKLENAFSRQLIFFEDQTCCFVHDRIQQAAYAMMDGARKKAVHLKVGRLLLQNTEEESLLELIFEIVDHLNTGAELLSCQAEKDEIAGHNLTACKKAREATAYEAMLKYVNQGIGLLGKDSWVTGYDLTLNLYYEAVEAEYLNTRFERAEKLAGIVIKRARTLLDKIRVYETIIQSHFAQNRMQAAIDTGMKVLKMFGVSLLQTPPRTLDIECFYQLPRIEDQEKLAVLRILKLMWAPVTISKQELLPKLIFTLVNRCIADGNSPYSSFAYAVYGMLLCWDEETIEKGYQFGELALVMLEQFESREMDSRVLEIVYFIHAWNRPMRIVVDKLRKLINFSLENGDIEVACNSHMSVCILLYFMGAPLESVCLEQSQHLVSIKKLKQDFQLKLAAIWSQMTLNLNGKADDPKRLTGKYFNEEQMLSNIEKEPGFTQFYFYLPKTILSYWLRDYTDALAYAEKAEYLIHHVVGFPIITLHNYFYSLTLLKMYPDAEKDKQIEYLKKVDINQKKAKAWGHHAPMNYQHHYDLVEAEKARISGHSDKALPLYEKAIKGSGENGYLHDEALGCELAGEFCIEQGLEEIAKYYINKAYDQYKRWGAVVRIQDLEKRYNEYLAEYRTAVNDTSETSTSLLTSTGLDLRSIIKASQAISSETDLEALLNKMMNIIMENSGADRGILLLKNENRWAIQAIGDIKTKEYAVLLNQPYRPGSAEKGEKPIPESIINVCIRSKEAVVVNNPLLDSKFAVDNYIQKNETKSILCIPLLNTAELNGILYLENSLTSGVFTDERIGTLKLISTQFSISLENALLYRSLDERLRFEKLLSKLSSAFVNLPADKVDMEIEHSLRILVEFLGVDIGSIAEFIEGGTKLRFSHSYVTPAVPEPPASLHQFFWYIETLQRGKTILLRRFEDLPEEAVHERQYFLKIGMKSHLAVPIAAGGTVLGIIAFSSFSKEQAWSDELVQRLRLVEEFFANVLERKQKEGQLQKRTIELRETAEKLKNLSDHLQEVREQERKGISREIHDEFGQALTVLRMDTSWVKKHIRDDPELLSEKIQTMIELIDATIKTVQRISGELRPGLLDDLGLVAAMEWHSQEFQKREGIQCRVKCEGEEVKGERYVTVLFRVFQEALTNISRHAQASEVIVYLKVNEEDVVLEISDNGRGITPEEINDKKSIGLIGIRERISFLYGKLDIRGNKNRGTKLKITLPLEGGIDD